MTRPTAQAVATGALVGAWALLPLTAGEALAAAADGRSTAVATTLAVLAWATWTGSLVALLVPRTSSLTAARLVVPTAAPAVAWAVVDAEATDALSLVGLTLAVAAAGLVLTAAVGDRFANGSSYGDERRFLLRPPIPAVAGPLELLWAAMAGAVVAGPLLLAARQWMAGGLVLAAAVPLVAFGVRAAHGLSRRWLVLVPAGLVVHDPMALLDTVLVQRAQVARLGPAPADTTATDLTMGAAGLALELDLTEPTEALALTSRGLGEQAVEVQPGLEEATERVLLQRLLVTPSRPGAFLRAAAERRLPVG